MTTNKSHVDWIDFETFTNTGVKKGEPFITISPGNTITLTSGFLSHAKPEIEEKTHVRLSFTKSKNAVSLDFTNNASEPGALKMTKRGNASIAAKRFLRWCEIDNVTGKYVATLEHIPEHGRLWTIYLK